MLYPLSYESGSTGPIEHSGVYGTPHPTLMDASVGCGHPGSASIASPRPHLEARLQPPPRLCPRPQLRCGSPL